MFRNNIDDEADFCEAYKAEILNGHTNGNDASFGNLLLKILAVVLLISIVVAASIYTYNYFLQDKTNEMPPISTQIIEDADLVVVMGDPEVNEEEEDFSKEEPIFEAPKSSFLPPQSKQPVNEESDIDKMAHDIKIEIAKKEEEERLAQEKFEESKEEIIEVPLSRGESSYVEELAKLVREVDKERK